MKSWRDEKGTIGITLLVLFLVFLWYSYHLRTRGGGATLADRVVLGVMGPVMSGIDAVAQGVTDRVEHYFWLVDTARTNDLLTQEVALLKRRLVDLEELKSENARLNRLLDYRQSVQRAAVAARVIGEDVSGWFRSVVIDKGGNDRLQEGMAVVVADGVVGRIVKTTDTTSQVLLAIDPSSVIGGIVQRTRTRTLCRGDGDSLSLEFTANRADIQPGDLVISSGLLGTFPKGVPIGKVAQVEKSEYDFFQQVILVPSVDFSRLEEVLVLTGGGY